MNFSDPLFWTSLVEIIGINVVLSGDNAVVIALAARSLQARQQKLAIAFGSAAAIVLRILLTVFAAQLLGFAWLKLAGATLLLWIGVQLFLDEEEGAGGVEPTRSLVGAIRTILVADLVMSLDNVIGVAAAAKGSLPLLVIGLALSIPLIVFSSTLILKAMQRFPVIITVGAGLIGFVAGQMAWTDPAIGEWTRDLPGVAEYAAGVAGAAFVIVAGRLRARRAAGADGKAAGGA